jgi:hypothetical protein
MTRAQAEKIEIGAAVADRRVGLVYKLKCKTYDNDTGKIVSLILTDGTRERRVRYIHCAEV